LSKRIAIVAGSGILPLILAKGLEDQGKNPFLIILRGEGDKRLYRFEHCELPIFDFSGLIHSLKMARVRRVVLAGGISCRPQLRDLCRNGWILLKAFPKIFTALGKGDDTLLRALITLIEGYGFHVLGAQEIFPDLLAPKGILTKVTSSKHDKCNILLAAEAARRLGELDIGQAAVAVGGRVVAVEGAEGTDNMLDRVLWMRSKGSIPRKGGGLVKVMKLTQDERVDLPTIGPKTIENAYKAALSGIAVEAGHTLILNLEETIKIADEYTMFIETL
jgi:hypothetical protein